MNKFLLLTVLLFTITSYTYCMDSNNSLSPRDVYLDNLYKFNANKPNEFRYSSPSRSRDQDSNSEVNTQFEYENKFNANIIEQLTSLNSNIKEVRQEIKEIKQKNKVYPYWLIISLSSFTFGAIVGFLAKSNKIKL